MSSRRDRRLSTITETQKYGQRASDRFLPVRHVMGKDAQGRFITHESFVDMHSKAGPTGDEKLIHFGENGWNDHPPSLPSGDPGRQPAYAPPSQRYRENYSKIDWGA